MEVVTAAYLSQDPVLCREIREGVDLHEANRLRFGLPDRTTAKIFKFRLLYGGQAWSYANAPAFQLVSRSERYWQDIIDEYYNKYKGMSKWHGTIIEQVQRTGRLVMPTGRIFVFESKVGRDGSHVWPVTCIKNYPVQGCGADLVCIGRVTTYKRLRKAGYMGTGKLLFQSTVHDSIDLDVDFPLEQVYNICKIIDQSVRDIPINFYRLFGVEFNLPVSAEISYGPTLGNLSKYDPNNSP